MSFSLIKMLGNTVGEVRMEWRFWELPYRWLMLEMALSEGR